MSGAAAKAGQWTAFAAVLPVTDLKASVAYYTECLGFSVKFQWGEPVVYAIIERESVELHLSPDAGTLGASTSMQTALMPCMPISPAAARGWRARLSPGPTACVTSTPSTSTATSCRSAGKAGSATGNE